MANTPLQTYRISRRRGYSRQASAIAAISEHAATVTDARDRTNRVRKVCPPGRKTFDPRSYGHG